MLVNILKKKNDYTAIVANLPSNFKLYKLFKFRLLK